MKLESKHHEKEWRVVEKAACSAMKGEKSKAKAKESIKPKAHTPGTSSEFCLSLMDV